MRTSLSERRCFALKRCAVNSAACRRLALVAKRSTSRKANSVRIQRDHFVGRSISTISESYCPFVVVFSVYASKYKHSVP